MSDPPTKHEHVVPAPLDSKPTVPGPEPDPARGSADAESKPAEDPADSSPSPTPACRRVQAWTSDGFPIVDGKYLDSAGLIRSVAPDAQVTYGPPQIDLFWQNLCCTEGYFGFEKAFNRGTATDCLIRLVGVVEKLGIEVTSLNVSRFSVILVTHSSLKRDQIMPAVLEAGL
ncbi:hypothetical protein GE09DRAFT_1182244 [Coniochaeta sp. 2T2.1]|nr:hypothetical protein GE09DRAFT_1182244 [Coniochaeta sp. 2T2.1]